MTIINYLDNELAEDCVRYWPNTNYFAKLFVELIEDWTFHQAVGICLKL